MHQERFRPESSADGAQSFAALCSVAGGGNLMSDRVTLQDVAQEAGVHASTASRALNPSTRSSVSEATVIRVRKAADRLAYTPHALARGLRTNRTMTVGIIVPDLENPMFPPMVRGVEAELDPAGYSLLIGNTDNDETRLRSSIDALLAQQVDGLILATALVEDGLVADVIERGVPLVLLNRHTQTSNAHAIVGADVLGIELAVAHLVSMGHRVIGHVAGPSTLSTGRNRATAFLDALAAAGIDPNRGHIQEADSFTIQPGESACRELITQHPEITAIVAANDLLALGCYGALKTAGFRIPDDISVTGYNDMPYVDLLDPPLTTVCVPYREMGRIGGRTLLDLMSLPPGAAPPPETVRLTPSLSARASTAPPRS
jgi:LacI family transcriptional regulator